MSVSIPVATLGAPRIGLRRELKLALERFWSGKLDKAELLAMAAHLRMQNWARQRQAGVSIIPSNDFSFYDHVLDTSLMVGAVPARYDSCVGDDSLETYFAMARGTQSADADTCCSNGAAGVGKSAQEMTKWFDTNYHYMVPEFTPEQTFHLNSQKVIREYEEARAQGYSTRPVLLGPVTFLKLGKSYDAGFDPLTLLERLLPVYGDVLRRLDAVGAEWVQIDEPWLVMDLDEPTRDAFRHAYAELAAAAPKLRLMLASYFGALDDNLGLTLSLPVAGLHLDLVRAPEQLERVVSGSRSDQVISLGVIDGRNIWRADLAAWLDRLESVVARLGAQRVQLAPSCSLLHVPIDLTLEQGLDPALREWLAFGVQKMHELTTLAKGLAQGRAAIAEELAASTAAAQARKASPLVHDAAFKQRAANVTPEQMERASSYPERSRQQRARLALPQFPTTTIGSFPQTEAVRKARAEWVRGTLDDAGYEAFLERETEEVIRWQEEIGLDVLVHGEFERNDMVQYFGEQLKGFAFTQHAWVQSYGSRCVRPPILFGDVSRPRPMTVRWWLHAQGLTDKPVKGMLTGPVTILNWSFVRDDVPRSEACRQIALAIRDEVLDLEQAGAAIIQIDEAALREGLPLKKSAWNAYLRWTVDSFRLCSAGVCDTTQIHTHMCYSEFNDIIQAIAAMDADVISIETSRSKMELLDAFLHFRYPNEIGPGVYDIHSPRVPEVAEMTELIELACKRLPAEQIWVNPDCGLKTRKWAEVRPALVNMVACARQLRAELPAAR